MSSPAAPITLQAVKAQFDEWRKHRQKKTRIPEVLWEAVRQLYPHYNFGRISAALHLSYQQLKSKLHLSSSKPNLQALPLFAECALPLIPSSPIEPNNACTIEFTSPQGITLKINGFSSHSLISLIPLLLNNAQ